jgi:sugar (pentulose or hexulose) kinase
MRLLGIDLGTSFLKGAILDLEASTLQHVRRLPLPEKVAGIPAGHHELDPEILLNTVRQLIGALLDDAPDAAGLVLCGQMHGLVFTDACCNPLSNIITWTDQRAQEPHPSGPGSFFNVLLSRVGPDELQRIGREIRVGVPIATLFWLAEKRQLKPGVFAVSLPDFVVAGLCGVEPSTEATNAAAYGLVNLAEGDWDRALLGKLGLSTLRWPRIRPFGEVVGVADVAGHPLSCFTPVGDHQCALVGSGLREGELSLNISTGSQISLLSRTPFHNHCLVRPYFDGYWLHTIVQLQAGRALDLIMDMVTEIARTREVKPLDPWEYIERELDRVGATDLEVDLAFYASTAAGGGAITHIREDNFTVGHLFAAAFRSMARNYAINAQRLSPERNWRGIVFSGGLAQRFARLRREILDQLGNAPEHRLSAAKEDTLLGLLRLGQVCAGLSASVQEALAYP